jgi:hypothetical protein
MMDFMHPTQLEETSRYVGASQADTVFRKGGKMKSTPKGSIGCERFV